MLVGLPQHLVGNDISVQIKEPTIEQEGDGPGGPADAGEVRGAVDVEALHLSCNERKLPGSQCNLN
jgi:hypothetical protein